MRPTHSLRPSLRPSDFVPSRARPRLTVPLTPSQQSLVEQYTLRAYRVLNKHFRAFRYDRPFWEELQQAAIMGLIAAARRYRPSRGTFSTFSYPTIWGTIKNAARAHARRATRDGSTEDDPGTFVPDWSDPDPLALASAAERRDRVRNALRFLDPTDAAIVTAHFGIDRPEQTFVQIAAALDLSRERVRQRYRRALARLLTHYNAKRAA